MSDKTRVADFSTKRLVFVDNIRISEDHQQATCSISHSDMECFRTLIYHVICPLITPASGIWLNRIVLICVLQHEGHVRETLKQRVYSHLFQKLSDGDLRPGDRLSGRSVAKELGVSPIPVRDAIGQLHSEGFFETRRGGGTFVPEPSYEDLMDIYDQREALECHAVARMAEAPNEQDLETLEKCITDLTILFESLDNGKSSDRRPAILDRWARTDAAYHDTLMRAAGNRRSLETVLNLRVRTRIYGMQICNESIESLRRTCESHKTILDRIRNKDAEGARLAMMEHIRSGCRLVIEAHYRKQGKLNASAGNAR